MGQRVSLGGGHVPQKWAPPAAAAETRLVHSGGARLMMVTGLNANAGTRYLLVFDAVAAPAPGTIAKLCIGPIGGVAPFSWESARGKKFTSGIFIAASTTGPAYTASGTADLVTDVELEPADVNAAES